MTAAFFKIIILKGYSRDFALNFHRREGLTKDRLEKGTVRIDAAETEILLLSLVSVKHQKHINPTLPIMSLHFP